MYILLNMMNHPLTLGWPTQIINGNGKCQHHHKTCFLSWYFLFNLMKCQNNCRASRSLFRREQCPVGQLDVSKSIVVYKGASVSPLLCWTSQSVTNAMCWRTHAFCSWLYERSVGKRRKLTHRDSGVQYTRIPAYEWHRRETGGAAGGWWDKLFNIWAFSWKSKSTEHLMQDNILTHRTMQAMTIGCSHTK